MTLMVVFLDFSILRGTKPRNLTPKKVLMTITAIIFIWDPSSPPPPPPLGGHTLSCELSIVNFLLNNAS